MTIPQILHQTWKSLPLPDQWRTLQQSWLDRHPGWAYRCWTDDENRDLVSREYPWLLPTYDGYDEAIKRVDAWRYVVLHRYGGVYVDLDCECVRPLDSLLAGHDLVLGQEPAAHAAAPGVRSRGFDQILCNAVMASAPGHPFWEHVLRLLEESRHLPSVLDATGPFLLTRAYQTYPDRERLSIVGPDAFYPFGRDETWDSSRSLEQLRSDVGAGSYAIHYWHGSWRREQVFKAVQARLRARRQGTDIAQM